MTTEPTEALTDLDDAELARRAGRRAVVHGMSLEKDAFSVLYDRHSPRLYTFIAARVGRSKVEDVFQDAWLRAWKALGEPARFDGRDFAGWLFTIAKNVIIDHVRRRSTTSLDVQGEEIVDFRGRAPDEYLGESERREALTRCLDRLRSDERAVFEARMGNDDFETIAARHSLPIQRIYKLLDQAKNKLRPCLERSGR